MDVLTFGESMVAFSAEKNESIVQANNAVVSIAGAESNVAIALARLGHDVKWLSRVGDDPFGEKILYELRAEGIDIKGVITDTQYSTGLMYKQKKSMLDTEVIYYRKQSAASNLSTKDIQPQWIKDTKIIHLTGITPSLSDSCKEMVLETISLAKQYNKLISFDPNIRLKLWTLKEARETLIPIIKACDFFFPGLEELKQLLGVETIEEAKKTLDNWNVPLTVVKDGAKGAWLLNHSTPLFVPSYKVEHVVDEVGAGDAFASGFLHGYLQNKDYELCIKSGHALAAFVISTQGDTKGLPTKRELERFWNTGETTIR